MLGIGISLGPGGSTPLVIGIFMLIGGIAIIGYKVNKKKNLTKTGVTSANQRPKTRSTYQKPKINHVEEEPIAIIPPIQKPEISPVVEKPISITPVKQSPNITSTEKKHDTKLTGKKQKSKLPPCPECGNTVMELKDYFCRECGYKLK